MRRYLLFIVLFFSLLNANDYLTWKDIPVQEDGRIKPLDTFSRNQLLRFYGKRSIGDNLSPSSWLFGVSTNNQDILNIPIFNIRNSSFA